MDTNQNNPRTDIDLNDFQLRNIDILTHLYVHNAVDDEIVEKLRRSELDYFSLLNKYKLLEQKINIDEKTNLLKFKKDYLTDIIKTASRIYFGSETQNFTIAFIRFDIDDFSVFNNQYGHDAGDEVLITIASIIREHSRPTDYVIRFGGEEFDVILPSTSIDGAVKYLENIFKLINSVEVPYNGQKLKVTVSAGVSSLLYSFNEKRIMESFIEDLFKQLQTEADNALYEAKYLGKNRYCIYSEDKKNEYVKIRKIYTK
ncbi:MAG TPA: GGDEF domain-containing protein [Spirochaetota bacterium]|nr:GGDEF domain-containing protein [Spirochaetota bacterium]HPI87837.1 GGDEF domain-containing protein [Spirochaetota bacterium]HPR47431.1 GGDEF domain-containing protein [Spirochaetota bacterium]